jgi:CubicO group peptidase (beta-lactamase class C family)
MNAFSAGIDRAVEDVRRHYLVPGLAIAVVGGGDAIHLEAYGLRNTAGSAAAGIDTAFAIGSCSKAFTCALAAALVDEGRLGWDDWVRTYLPASSSTKPWISDHLTIRDLLANRTGLSRASVGEYGSDLSRPSLLQRARFIPPLCGFRDQFTYSNIGYASAAEAMAQLSGRAFDQLMDHHVLQMTASRAGNPSSQEDNIAAPHYKINGVVQPVA